MSQVVQNARSVTARAVHLKIYPRPRTIYESRQILTKLKRYGEIVAYKNLRYEVQSPVPNTALAIYQNADAAKRLLASAPLRISIPEEVGPSSEPEALMQRLEPAASPSDQPATSSSREFYITAGPSNFPHAAYIARQRYYGNFTPRPVSIPAEDLTASAPLAGLATAPGWDGRPASASEVPTRIARRLQKKVEEMKTPSRMWEKVVKEKGR